MSEPFTSAGSGPASDLGSREQDERVAVVVVMYNSGTLIEGLLESLRDGMAGVSFELIAVDNASPDDSATVLRSVAPWATLVRTGRNGGYSAGINAGVAAAGPHSAILVVNSDVRLSTGCVAELLLKLRSPGVGIVVPRLIDGQGKLIDSMRREPTVFRAFCDALLGARVAGRLWRLGEVATDPRSYDHQQPTDWAEGSTQLISADCWRACGPWDESFFLYSEETEFNLRARDNGYQTIYVPSALAVHLEGGSGTSDALWALQVINRVRLFGRRHGHLSTALFWSATMMREGTRAIIGRRRSRAAVKALLNPAKLRAGIVPVAVQESQ